MTDRQAIFAELHRQLDTLEEEIARLERSWKTCRRDICSELEPEMEEVRRRQAVATRIESLKHGSELAWDDSVCAFERARDELRAALGQVKERLPDGERTEG